MGVVTTHRGARRGRRRRPGRPPAAVDGGRRSRSCSATSGRRGSTRSPGRWATGPASTPRAYAEPLDADVAVLAGPPGTHARAGPPLRGRRHPGGVGDRRDRRRPGPARPRRRGPRARRDGGGRRRVRARAVVRAGRPRRRPVRRGRRDPRGQGRHRRPGLRPPAPPGPAGPWPSTGATAAGPSARPASGRELCWFPDPIGAEDCYRAALPDALLLVPAFPGVDAGHRPRRGHPPRPPHRPAARCCGRPHPEGGPGAIRVEVRGRRGTSRDVVVLGAMDRPAVAAGAVAAADRAVGRRGPPAPHRRRRVWPSWSSRVPFLAELRAPGRAGRGVPARRRPRRLTSVDSWPNVHRGAVGTSGSTAHVCGAVWAGRPGSGTARDIARITSMLFHEITRRTLKFAAPWDEVPVRWSKGGRCHEHAPKLRRRNCPG